MMYLKLSIRNAKRSFTDYLLYVVTMTVLLAIMEISNCIAIMGELANFQTISLPLLITIIQAILVVYIDNFILRQRAKGFTNYLLLGMNKKKLTNLFLCEILLIGLLCFLIGTTIGFSVYGLFCLNAILHEIKLYVFLYGKSILYTFCCFCLVEIICTFSLKKRLEKLQIRELMYEKNRNQSMKKKENYKKWRIAFIFSFVCMIGFVCGIVFLPEDHIVYAVSFVVIPLLVSIYTFYKWIFSYLYTHRKTNSVNLYQKNRLYIMASLTSNFKTTAIINTVFCVCFLFSVSSFFVGMLMLQPEIRLFDTDHQQWMGLAQICICIVFAIIYFSILSLQQIIELRQDSKNNQILRCIGRSDRQIETLVNQIIVIKLSSPMIMALIIFLFCIPLLNVKMNSILPITMHNIIWEFAGEFFLCTLFFNLCYFLVVSTMSKQYIKSIK